jgi:gliding motility-associated-like protein
MKNLRKILSILVFVILGGNCLLAQNLSNRGKDFWVGYGHHQSMEVTNPPVPGGNQDMILYFSAEQAANVVVTINGTAYVRNYFVPANGVLASETIPKSGTVDARLFTGSCTFVPPGFPCGGEGFFNTHAIHITSDVPIVVYAHIYDGANSGATMLLPVESWGYSYQTINSKQNYAANCFSWAYIIAQHDNTLIEVIPSQATRRGLPANVPFNITLNRGQIYQFMAGPEAGTIKPEFTGTRVRSIANAAGECYPIAVFAGSSRTYNAPVACGSPSGGDNDNQQCFPFQVWGKKYVTAPTSNSSNASTPMWNTFKIAVKDPTTVVTRNGTPLTGLTNNTYEFLSNTADVIEADKPIMVGQFMHSGSACQGGTGVGDPEMIYISPVEQGIKRIGFYRNNRTGITVNYLTLIIPTAGLSSLLIDGSSTFNHTYPHPNYSGYSVVVKRWSASQAQATAQSDSAFTAITYGLGSVESYGYNAGTFLNNLNAVGAIFNTSDTSTTTTSHPFTCTNTPFKLSVLLRYPTPPTKLVWKLSLVGGGLSPNTDVTDNSPTPVGSQVVNGVSYFKYDLPGTYTFTTTGTYTIPILATHPTIDNCNNTEEVSYQVEVRGKPSTDFAITHTGCVLDTVQFTGQTLSANGYNLNQWRYTFPDAMVANSKDTAKLFAAPGTYNVNLRIVSTEGCVGDTTKQVVIYPKPTAAFTVVDPTVCVGNSITVNSTANYTGTPGVINNYYWNFGDGTIINAATNAPQSHTYTTHGTYTIKHVAGVSNLCVSDTAVQTVTIYARPTTSFTYPAGCLPASGTVQFTSTATTPDGQAITGHLWTFGHPSPTPASSTLANPTYTYPGFGNYTITYQTTTANGCVKDTTVNATFNLAPSFSYPALAPVCGNSGNTVNVATATVTNGVPGTGVYSGTATTSAGVFNPALSGPGTHTIWYVYTATSGCKDSISQTITVAPVPQANFSFSPNGCLPANGQVNFTYTGTAQAGQTYSWDFGDGSPAATIANPTHTYTAGTYQIILTVTNPTTGCIKKDTVNQTFNLTPALAYPPLAATCQNSTSVNVATATVTNGVTGTGVYSGPGTSASGVFNPSVAGAGTHTITYTFTSTSGNCVATATQTITVAATPQATFSFTPPGCLPPNGQVNFTYTGTAQAGQTYSWNFGDGSPAATTANPTNVYSAGTYQIILTVTNPTTGCVEKDTVNQSFNVTPALAYPALAATCENVTSVNVATATVTNGVTGTGVYSGPGVSPAGIFNPSVAGPGTHTITYTFTSASGNCVEDSSQTIVVNAKPNASFTAPTGCLPASGMANFSYTGTAQAGQTYLWNFGDPASGANNTSTLQNPSHTYTTGNYQVILEVTNPTTGCIDRDTLNQTFNVTPALAYPTLNATCENLTNVNVATATVTNGVPGTGVYSGPGVSPAGIFNPSLAGPGTHTITYTFTSASGNCVEDSSQTIVVNAKPNASFTAPTGCLPASGVANFTYTGTSQAGQTYLWNFGDPASGANNTSTLQNPSHTYTTGNYQVILEVTNPTTGCIDRDTLNQTFNVTPALAYPPLAAACENETSVNVATATVTNGVTGTGVYSGPGVSPSGIFNPSVAGPGTHNITYTFTSGGNCVEDSSQTIVVNPKPVSAFTITATVCQGQTATISSNATIPSGSISQWQWFMGDGNTYTFNNGNSFTHTYANANTYTVKLVTVSADGCISDTARQNITVSPVPVAAFTMPASVCMPNGNVQFTNTSTIADNSALSYSWNFGDGSPASTLASPSHVYASSGTYNVTLTVTGATGCSATTSQVFDDFFDKPIAAFTADVTEICSGTAVRFTDGSTAPNSTISSWKYIFSDGTELTQQNPTKTFSNAGSFTVRLVVTSAQGCVSDTSAPVSITVHQQPQVNAGPDFVVAQGTTVQFLASSNTPGVNILWSPATGLSDATILRPTHVAVADAGYMITLSSGNGFCTATDNLTVKILRPLRIPNAFSPNGDNINDRWEIENLADYTGAIVEIFNRYGQMVWKSAGYATPWDGTSNGKPLPLATYYYVIQLKNGFKPISGSITLIR